MYAVIFRAKIGEQDFEYNSMLKKMRELAFSKYNCVNFVAVTEGNQEIAISYWDDLKNIIEWKKDLEHQSAQEKAKNKWYTGYRVEVVEIKRQYEFGDLG